MKRRRRVLYLIVLKASAKNCTIEKIPYEILKKTEETLKISQSTIDICDLRKIQFHSLDPKNIRVTTYCMPEDAVGISITMADLAIEYLTTTILQCNEVAHKLMEFKNEITNKNP